MNFCSIDKMYSHNDTNCTSFETDLSSDEIDVEFEKVIKQLEFATWMKTLDELIEIEEVIKKIEIDYYVNYHKQ